MNAILAVPAGVHLATEFYCEREILPAGNVAEERLALIWAYRWHDNAWLDLVDPDGRAQSKTTVLTATEGEEAAFLSKQYGVEFSASDLANTATELEREGSAYERHVVESEERRCFSRTCHLQSEGDVSPSRI